jgi:hypothetical protein
VICIQSLHHNSKCFFILLQGVAHRTIVSRGGPLLGNGLSSNDELDLIQADGERVQVFALKINSRVMRQPLPGGIGTPLQFVLHLMVMLVWAGVGAV